MTKKPNYHKVEENSKYAAPEISFTEALVEQGFAVTGDEMDDTDFDGGFR